MLLDEWLKAENLEILYFKSNSKKFKSNVPSVFSLKKGHQLFFKNKLKYINLRQHEVKNEMIRRGFKCSQDLELYLKGDFDYMPTFEDKKIIIKRLIEKIKLKPNFYHYYSIKINSEFFINILEMYLNGFIDEARGELLYLKAKNQLIINQDTFINLSIQKNKEKSNRKVYKLQYTENNILKGLKPLKSN